MRDNLHLSFEWKRWFSGVKSGRKWLSCLNSERTPLIFSGLSNLCTSSINTSPNLQCSLTDRFDTPLAPCCCGLADPYNDRGHNRTLATHPGLNNGTSECAADGVILHRYGAEDMLNYKIPCDWEHVQETQIPGEVRGGRWEYLGGIFRNDWDWGCGTATWKLRDLSVQYLTPASCLKLKLLPSLRCEYLCCHAHANP